MDINWINVGAGVVISALGWWIRHLHGLVTTLFDRYDKLNSKVAKLQLAMVAVDPSKTAMFEAFMRDDK